MKNARTIASLGFWIILFFLFTFSISAQEYVLLGWNDLGMHCSNKDFAKVVVLPPYNNVSAQLIYKANGQPPQIVNSGYAIEYSIPNNTYSVGKTNFWSYAQQLFGLASPLPDNIGLTGKDLTGTLDSSGNYFAVHGIPITPFADSDHVNEAPFQLIHLVAKNKSNGAVLATTDVVIPVSNEVGCVQSGCHSSETSILNSHPGVTGFNRSGPVLCASCHASNALGTTGTSSAKPFSLRIHEKHSGIAGPSNAIETCYKCHPGPKTQCLRDIMGKNPANPMVCQDCHGTMAQVAATIDAGRRPWLDEPKCGDCHGSAHAEQPGKLFRESQGHGGLFCSACHGSPHAIQPTIQPNDNLQNIRLQGYAGTLGKCSVCHATPPAGTGPHGLTDTTSYQPSIPLLSSPPNGTFGIGVAPLLQWSAALHSISYNVQIAADSFFTTIVKNESLLTITSFQSTLLNMSQKYFWRVRSKNSAGNSDWSAIWSFTTGSGTSSMFSFNGNWNLISLPMSIDNPAVNLQFPFAVSNAYEYVPSGGYYSRDSLTLGKGYWLKFSSSNNTSITGQPITSNTIGVSEGWNLIGALSDTVPVSSVASSPAGIISSMFFGYNNGYLNSDFLIPAHGYWVKSSSAGSVIFSVPGGQSEKKINSLTQMLQNSNRLILRDAEGREQKLYLARNLPAGLSYSFFESPPLPPEGIFDARFSSNRFVEITNGTAEYPVSIKSAVYPLSVKLESNSPEGTVLLNIDGKNIEQSNNSSIILDKEPSFFSLVVKSSASLPAQFTLEQNYPNPFNPSTMVNYQLPIASRVTIKVYNILGVEITTLVDGYKEAGTYTANFDVGSIASGLPSGIYLYKMNVNNSTYVKKMVYMR
ncbi:MAG: T9SS type A sorting domain-containing protein [Ignavibacteriales bacterium]|nr:T9SS type A sorting domain-containing protein [Ignavibacteriales bacterium]